METNACDVNYLDKDAHLPPRKRLLAGFKRQSSDVTLPSPSTVGSSWSKYTSRLNYLLRSQLSNTSISNEEIVESSKFAVIEARKLAEAARANAEDKAEKAAKAKAAAKSALELVATLSEKTARKEKYSKKNRMKKHIPVQALYSKKKGKTNCKADEESASNLHRVINSSPRVLKNSSGSDMKNQKHKRQRSSTCSGASLVSNGIPIAEGSRPSTATRNGYVVARNVDTEAHIKEADMITIDLNTLESGQDDQMRLVNEEQWRPSKIGRLQMDNSELEPLTYNDKLTESSDSFGKKRGRIKQKKLPLSICSFKDQTNFKEELKSRGTPQSGDKTSRTAVGNLPLFPVGPSGNSLMLVERTNMWKCQTFKAPACVKQNKVVQP